MKRIPIDLIFADLLCKLSMLFGSTIHRLTESPVFNELFEKMQAKQGFENSSMITTALRIAKTDGIKGFYRF